MTPNGEVVDGVIDGHANAETASRLNQDSHTPTMIGDSMLGKIKGCQIFFFNSQSKQIGFLQFCFYGILLLHICLQL